ncbi:protein translocase subunit SecF [Vibrio ishigakensis]|nr:protein translocase subunit SecF [Vibrio ishigakensis]
MNISNLQLTRTRLGMSFVSALLFALSLMVITLKGFNWGLDFTGGVVAEVRLEQSLSQAEIKLHLDQSIGQEVSVNGSTAPGLWEIRYNPTYDTNVSLPETLESLDASYQMISSSIIGPQVGQEMVEQGGLAILVCLLLTMLYLSYRFEWRFALGALVALLHDVVLVLGLFSLIQMEFNLTILAAVLAVLGYSLNDSIIIADRARELFKAKPRDKADELINQAVRATFSRTLVTSGTTLVTVSSLWLLGGAALEGFAIALVVGIVSGTWSSISMGVTLPQLVGVSPEHYKANTPVEGDALP